MKILKLLPEEKVLSATTHAKISPRAPAFLTQMPGAPFLTYAFSVAVNGSSRLECFFQNTAPASVPLTNKTRLIYAVDDMPDMTELYETLLEETGYRVKTFNDRAEALAALKADTPKPSLLITDYIGLSMPADRFLWHCLVEHPALRILMASGFTRTDMRFSQARPNRFIQKPFTPEELRQGVRGALSA